MTLRNDRFDDFCKDFVDGDTTRVWSASAAGGMGSIWVYPLDSNQRGAWGITGFGLGAGASLEAWRGLRLLAPMPLLAPPRAPLSEGPWQHRPSAHSPSAGHLTLMMLSFLYLLRYCPGVPRAPPPANAAGCTAD